MNSLIFKLLTISIIANFSFLNAMNNDFINQRNVETTQIKLKELPQKPTQIKNHYNQQYHPPRRGILAVCLDCLTATREDIHENIQDATEDIHENIQDITGGLKEKVDNVKEEIKEKIHDAVYDDANCNID